MTVPATIAGTPVSRDALRKRSQLRIVFVHTPMTAVRVDERELFWRTFDIRYHRFHPGLRHMRRHLWELPHWMPWLAGVLVSAGYDNLKTVDLSTLSCSVTGIDAGAVADRLRKTPGDVYLFSPMTVNLSFALQIAEQVKLLYPDSATIFGGVVATPLHKEVAANSFVDFVISGRGEYALPALLDCIDRRVTPEHVRQLTHRLGSDQLVVNDRLYPTIAADALPFPKVDLFPEDFGLDIRYLRIVYGLGCPYRCDFCTIQTIGRKPQYFSTDRVLSEIESYRSRYGRHHNIYFGDETFTLNPAQTRTLCHALRQVGHLQYDCQTRLNLLSDLEMLKLMAASGCKWVEVGVESVNQESQDLFKQKTKLSDLVDTLRRVKDHGMGTCSFVVNGLPNQNVDDMMRSIDNISELLIRDLLDATYLFGLVPYPGSSLHHTPDRYGIKLHHRDFKLYHEDLPPVFDTALATSDEIYEVFLYGLRELGRNMSGSDTYGRRPDFPDDSLYGAFWESSHV